MAITRVTRSAGYRSCVAGSLRDARHRLTTRALMGGAIFGDGATRFGGEVLESDDDLLLVRGKGAQVELPDQEIDCSQDPAQLQSVAPDLAEDVLLDVSVAGVPVNGDEMLEPPC